jgi:hypothetical protein
MAKKEKLFTTAQRLATIQKIRDVLKDGTPMYQITKGSKVPRTSIINVIDKGKDMGSDNLAKIGDWMIKMKL